MKRPSIAVIVSTYERPDALAAVLRALADQDDRDFDVIVADDGSGDETRSIVDRFHSELASLQHVWQEDEGFRLSASRNRAIAAARAEVLVFIDGDCLVRPDYVRRLRALICPGAFLRGSRVRISERLTRTVLEAELPAQRWPLVAWIGHRFRGGVDRVHPLLRLPLGPLRGGRPRRLDGAHGCNLAVWRDDLIAVNGFDESFEGWGEEDRDLVARLVRSGVRRIDGRYAIPVLHLWHPTRAPDEGNRRRLEDRRTSSITRAEVGLEQHL